MTRRSPLAPRWIVIALTSCIGLGVAGIWKRSADIWFFQTAAPSALPASRFAGEVLRDLAGARSPETWPAAWRGK